MKNSIWFEKIENNMPDYDIKCYACDDDINDSGISTSMHNHRHIEFIYVTHGSMDCMIMGEDKLVLSEGDVAFINVMVPHETKVHRRGDTGICILQFVPGDFLGAAGIYKEIGSSFVHSGKSCCIFKKDENSRIRKAIESVYSENTERETGYEAMILGNLYFLIGELFRRGVVKLTERVSGSNLGYMKKAIAYIDDNYKSNISLESICKEVNISPTHFCRLFKSFAGITFVQYLNFIRAREAEKLVSKTDMSITEIAFASGFSSPAYFDRIFKRHYKISPAKYRDMQKRGNI